MKLIIAAALASLLAGAAYAADNTLLVTPCGSGCVTTKSKDVGGGVEAPQPIISDTSGNPLATAPGTGNSSFALPIQGVASGVAVPVSGSVNATLQASGTTAIGKVDPNTIATWGIGTAGSPTTNVVTVQGVSGGTAQPASVASGGIASGAYASGAISDGALVTLGTKADSACGTSSGTCTEIALLKYLATTGLPVPQASPVGGALSSTWLASAASNNATNVKNAAGTLYTVTVTQSTTTAMELKLYNTSSSPTCSSATSLVDIIPIPSNATSPGFHLPYPVGRAFSTGISFCLVAFGNPAAGTDNSNAVTGATVSMTYD